MCIKNRIVSLIYKVIFVVICTYGIYLNSGAATGNFSFSMLNYFTILSNLLCLVFFIGAVYKVIKELRRNGIKGKSTLMPNFKGAVTMAITVTFLIFHFLLSPTLFSMGTNAVSNTYMISNMIVHYIVPIMVILDWLLFDPKGKFKALDPLKWTIIPLVYFVFTIIRAQLSGELIYGSRYPYFFIDFDKYGTMTVLRNVAVITLFFIVLGYIIYFIDKGLAKLVKTKDEKEKIEQE